MCGGNSRLPLREKQVSLWGMGVPGTTIGLFLTQYQNGEDVGSRAGKEQRLGLSLALHYQSRIRASVPGTFVLSYFCVSNTPDLCPLCVPLCDQAFSQVSRCMGQDRASVATLHSFPRAGQGPRGRVQERMKSLDSPTWATGLLFVLVSPENSNS